MRKGRIAFGAIIVIAGIAFIGISNGKTKTVKTGGILSVNDIQADPHAFKGAITINGVVAQVSSQGQKLFLMVDTAEAKHCKSTGCARFYLSVKYEGIIPKEWDEVNVTGSFIEGSRVFNATKVEVLRHLTFK